MAINAGMRKAQAEYMRFVKSLDPKIKGMVKDYLDRVESNLVLDSFTKADRKEVLNAVRELQDKIKSVMQDGNDIGLEAAKKYKEASFDPYLTSVKKLLKQEELPMSLAEGRQLNLVFSGGIDEKIVDGVWNKVWPDSLTVDDRISKLGKRFADKTEDVIKAGITEGKSASNIAKDLRDHFDTEGIERKSALRLAAYTTNCVYQTAQAEISIAAKFVMGIRVSRGMYGPASDSCDICAEHGGEPEGPGVEYTKDDFGGRSYDLYVMANAPAYHTNCNCGVEDIFESAEEFVQKARAEYEG